MLMEERQPCCPTPSIQIIKATDRKDDLFCDTEATLGMPGRYI